MKTLKTLILLSALLVFSGCSTLMPALFGLHEINGYNEEECAKFYKKLPKNFAFTPIVCGDDQYFQVSRLGADSLQMKNLYQPLRIMYFHSDSLVSFHINCYCPPTISFDLKWNYNHQFDVFPPTTSVALDGYTVTRSQLMSIFPEIKGDSDYTVIVFWTNMLSKISRSEIKTVYKNLKKHGPSTGSGTVEVYLINDDIPLTKSVAETD